jgi:hypothetical protein
MTVTEFAHRGTELKQVLDLITEKYNGTPLKGKSKWQCIDEEIAIANEIKSMIFVCLQELGWDISAGVGEMPRPHLQIFPIDDFHTELKFFHIDKKCKNNLAYRIQLNCRDFTYENTDYIFSSETKKEKHTKNFFLKIEFKSVTSIDIPRHIEV